MLFVLFCVLLIGHHAQAVVNKATSQVPLAKEEEKPGKAKVEDRISNTFASPADDYGPPLGSGGFNGPAPVYGPPELVGNLGPTPIYPPPPPELPPPAFGTPIVSYGSPPRTIKPQYGPPLKQSFASLSASLLAKPIYGPPKLHYGPPKQHFTPPTASFPPFRYPKPQYAPPLKLLGTSSQQYLPPLATSQHEPPKPSHILPIPISLETYGPPPPAKLAIQFNPLPNDEYGPPPPPPPPGPQPQYRPPAGDLYEPPPAPPPGVPAPPTPPDIKYDGWQPIAGLASSPNQSGPPTDTYGPPSAAKYNYVEASSSSGTHLSHASLSVPTNPNVPSDSYGVPIHNPDAQDLKTSVHQSSASSESNGLPPPPLPQQEPLHNNQGPGTVISVGHADHHVGAGLHQQQPGLQYAAPNVEPSSVVKTAGFELLPTSGGLNADLQGLSLSAGTSDVSSFNHISNSVNANSASLHSGLELTSDDGGSHAVAAGNDGLSHGFQQNPAVDLSLQQLPHLPRQKPASDYGAPFNTFGKYPGVSSGTTLLSPPPLDSYGAPPLSSYSPNGPYPGALGGRGTPVLPPFGLFGGSFHKQSLHYTKAHAPFKAPPAPPGSLIPPRIREPIKFREPIPTGLLSDINRYVPPFTKQKLHGSIPLGQQLPSYHAPVPFRYASGPANSFSGSFSSGAGRGGYNLNSPIAAPHVQYGTPLSFTDFNTPAPHLTYGAPNFGPPTSYVSTFSGFGQNLYSGIGNALMTTYGTPIVNTPLPISGGGNDCNSLQQLFPSNGGGSSASGEIPLSGSLPLSGELHSSGEAHLSGGLSSGGGVPSSEELSLGLSGGLPVHGGAHSSGKLQLGLENLLANPVGHAEGPAPVFIHQLSTGYASPAGGGGTFETGHLSPVFQPDSLSAKPLDNFLAAPSVNTLDLQHSEQQKINLKDSYGQPVGVTYDAANEATDPKIVHATTPDFSNELPAHPSSQIHDTYSVPKPFHPSGITPEAFTASLTEQAYGRANSFGSNEVDADQFFKSSEGSEALSMLKANNAGDFEVHGSKGTYTLQIQPANGLGTENADGTIRHEHVLSNGLLQKIITAIERPKNPASIQIQGRPESQLLNKVFDSQPEGTGVKDHFISAPEKRDEQAAAAAAATSESEKYLKIPSVALFYNNKYDLTKKEIRSVSRSEARAARENAQGESNAKSS